MNTSKLPSRAIALCLLLTAALSLALESAAATDIQFVDVSGARGIGPYTSPLGWSTGVNTADFDDDGDLDIFVPTGEGVPDQLYENDGNGNFTDVAAAAGVASTDTHRAALFFDYDGDGLLDLAVAGDCNGQAPYTCTADPLVLYHQDSPGSFSDVTLAAGISIPLVYNEFESVSGMAAGDIDNDGYLDLFVSVFGQPTWLFLNLRDGSFSDISLASGVGSFPGASGWQPTLHDWNGDGWMDIYESVDFSGNRLWINQGDNTFSDAASAAGLDSSFNDMGMALGDADNDGDLDIFLSNIATLGKHNVLYRNDSVGASLAFTDVAAAAGVDSTGWSWGSTLFDADNDGWLDLAVTNGADTIPPWTTDASRFFLNDGTTPLSFTDESTAAGFDDTYIGSALVSFDYDGDGDLDLLQSTTVGGPLRLLENQYTGGGSPNNYLVVKPRRVLGGNRRGIGAVVRATVGGTTYTRLITAGTSMQGQEPAEALFGVGTAATVDTVEITWPDGSTTTQSSVTTNQVISVSPVLEIAISPPNTTSTQTGPLEWIVSYVGADSVTLAPGECTLHTTGSATGTIGISGSGTSQRTISVTGLSGVGTLSVSIAAGTASESGGGSLAPATGQSLAASVDSDEDLDGVLGSIDNCPAISNPLQEDTDRDGEGDACNGANDTDSDEWSDTLDNCPLLSNPAQTDLDFDGIGDDCDPMVANLSVARRWNEALLQAIRRDYPAPTVHSRNLFHISAGMWDAWAAYDFRAKGYFVDEIATSPNIEAARKEAISFAAYRILKARFVEPKSSPDSAAYASATFDSVMLGLGYDKDFTATSGGVNPPAELGNLIAEEILMLGMTDGSNEAESYTDDTYTPLNPEMLVDLPGVLQPTQSGIPAPQLPEPNHWQPLALEFLILQNGIAVGQSTQEFLGSHWGDVTPFAMTRPTPADVYNDPGDPPYLGCDPAPPCASDTEFKDAIVRVIEFSSWVDPDDGVTMDISPASLGNSPLGTNDGTGYAMNPKTGQPYAPNIVKRGDYGRILAEFWADGPDSETPPGHWNSLANYVSDHPQVVKRVGGTGPIMNDLEWDVKLYFALNGAVSDAAIAAWDAKRKYDYVRPVTQIRYMGGKGQSSDSQGPSYHVEGLPLVPGLIEVVTVASSAPGERHENVLDDEGQPAIGAIAIRTWPGQPADPHNEYSGVEWIRAIEWLPYQRETFVSPPFAAYISGHSAFSRAAAELLTQFTGDAYFPGGLGTFVAPQDTFLEFEIGPTQEIVLEWARYYDAADEAGISRLWGGIHVDADDLNGRIVGSQVGAAAWAKAQDYYARNLEELLAVPGLHGPAAAALATALLGTALVTLRRRRRARA